jgi:hypothetical protein
MTVPLAAGGWAWAPCGVNKLRGGCSPRPGSPDTEHVDGDILNPYYIATRC